MSIKLNDNIKINAGKPSESKYLSTGNTAYLSINDVNAQIPIAERYIGLTVLIDSGSTNIEHWYKEGVSNTDLIEKKFASEQLVGDFITGATNLGYFSGQTGVQKLTLSGFPSTPVDFDGDYYSEYNWYYADSDGIIRIGSPTYGGTLRRAYVDLTRTKSWIYNVGTSAWAISNNDVSANVGNSIVDYSYAGSGYTQTEWTGFTSNGSTSIDVSGSLTTGDTLTIGNPIYRDKDNQNLNFRTIISDTPEFIKIINDENYTHFSGVSSILTASNYGGGIEVYSGQSGNNLQFRTLVQSGDTSIIQQPDGKIVIYSSSNGSANAITGATSVGSGVDIYSGSTDRNLQFKTLVGSGSTTITDSGNTVIIGSTGSGGDVFTEDILVSIASGKTFGRYQNGDTIPAIGKTPNEVILLSLAEPLEPTVNLSDNSQDVDFGLSGKTVNVIFSYTINSAGASVSSTVLEWRRGNTGSWSGLTSNTGATSYFHEINDSANRFNTAVINYRYTVIDSEGATKQVTYDVTPQGYAAPTINPDYNASSLQSYENQQLREIGNISTVIDGSINSNRSLVNLLEYRIQRDDGSGYITIASASTINALTKLITAYTDNSAISNATTIKYRVVVDDEWTTTTSSEYIINFRYASYFGYNTNTSLSGAQIVGLGNEALLTSRVRTIDPVTAPSGNYTYISYPASFGDLTNVIMDGASPVLGSFTKLSDVNVTNYYGETVNNIIYKSNAPAAFTDNELAFS